MATDMSSGRSFRHVLRRWRVRLWDPTTREVGFRRIRDTRSGGAEEAEDRIGFVTEGKIEIDEKVGVSILY